jgi:hypothetical protein
MAFAASRGRSSQQQTISANSAPSQHVPAAIAVANHARGPLTTAAIAATSTQPASEAKANVADCALNSRRCSLASQWSNNYCGFPKLLC